METSIGIAQHTKSGVGASATETVGNAKYPMVTVAGVSKPTTFWDTQSTQNFVIR